MAIINPPLHIQGINDKTVPPKLSTSRVVGFAAAFAKFAWADKISDEKIKNKINRNLFITNKIISHLSDIITE